MGKSITAEKILLYNQEREERVNEFRALADLYVSGVGSKERFDAAMRSSLREYYSQLAMIAKDGRPLIERDRQDIARFLSTTYKQLDGFVKALPVRKAMSDAQILHRASSYAPAWGIMTRFGIPAVLADALPALPGFDCLGMSLCGCWLEWQAGLNSIEVYWRINPIKEHCVLCLSYTAEWSPYIVEIDDLNSDLLEEEYEFLYEE